MAANITERCQLQSDLLVNMYLHSQSGVACGGEGLGFSEPRVVNIEVTLFLPQLKQTRAFSPG